MKIADQIDRHVDAGNYSEALRLGLKAGADGVPEPEVMKSMFRFTAKLRSDCMDMACNKATDGGPEHLALEAMLCKANEVTGEDMYGRMA